MSTMSFSGFSGAGGSGDGGPSRRYPYNRLKELGWSDEELDASRKKLDALVKEIDEKASLSPEVEEVLLEMSMKFVESAAKFGCKLAQHRGQKKQLELEDLRLYVEPVLGIHVPGYGSPLTGNLPPNVYADAHMSGKAGRPTEKHLAILKSKRKAHAVLEDSYAVATGMDQKKVLKR